jgi:hypothetical protein
VAWYYLVPEFTLSLRLLHLYYVLVPGYLNLSARTLFAGPKLIRWIMHPLDACFVRCVLRAGEVTTTAPTQACATAYIQCTYYSTHTVYLYCVLIQCTYYSTRAVYSYCTTVLILCAHTNTGLTATVSEWLGRMRQATSASTQVYIAYICTGRYPGYSRVDCKTVLPRLQYSITKATIQYYPVPCTVYHAPCTIHHIHHTPYTIYIIHHTPYTPYSIYTILAMRHTHYTPHTPYTLPFLRALYRVYYIMYTVCTHACTLVYTDIRASSFRWGDAYQKPHQKRDSRRL